MKTSKLFTALAGMAVVAFPVTIAIVTFGVSNSAQKVQNPSNPDAAAQDSSPSSPVSKAETKSSRVTEEQASKTPAQAVVQALRVRVKELGEAIEQAKVEEVQLKVALEEKQVFQKVTSRNLKATQRAIKEIEGTTSTSPTLRGPKPALGQQRQSSQSSLPDGWQLSQALRAGTKWLVTMHRPNQTGPFQIPRTFMSLDGNSNSFAEVYFPQFQEVHPARNVTLPAGISYPLGVLKFTP
jgi:hypothetical protein